jgi:hypothetical protein
MRGDEMDNKAFQNVRAALDFVDASGAGRTSAGGAAGAPSGGVW